MVSGNGGPKYIGIYGVIFGFGVLPSILRAQKNAKIRYVARTTKNKNKNKHTNATKMRGKRVTSCGMHEKNITLDSEPSRMG